MLDFYANNLVSFNFNAQNVIFNVHQQETLAKYKTAENENINVSFCLAYHSKLSLESSIFIT